MCEQRGSEEGVSLWHHRVMAHNASFSLKTDLHFTPVSSIPPCAARGQSVALTWHQHSSGSASTTSQKPFTSPMGSTRIMARRKTTHTHKHTHTQRHTHTRKHA